MTRLYEGQYQIGDLIMGPGTPIQISTFDPAGYEVQAADQNVVNSDEVRFGFDYVKPSPIAFELGILDNFDIWRGPDFLLPGMKSGMELAEQLAFEWRADRERKVWNSQKPLRYKKNGPQKIIFGRPRKLTIVKTRKGAEFIPAVMEFQPVDTFAYSDEEFGQVVLPSAAGTKPGNIKRRGGKGETWARFLLVGPIVNPIITVGNLWKIQMNLTLAAGKVLEINAYPWERRVVDSDSNTRAANLIGDSAYMDEMKLPPDSDIPFGLSGTGTTTATYLAALWREAYLAY